MRCSERDTVQPESETDSDQSQFMRSRFPRSQCLRRRTVGTRRTLQETSQRRFPFVSRWIQTRQDTFYSAGDQADSNTLSYDVWQYKQWIREKRLSVSRVDTKNNTEDLFTKHLDGLPTQSFAKKLGLRIPWYERR